MLGRVGRAFAAFLSGGLLLAVAAASLAEDAEPAPTSRAWDIRADTISYDRERDVYTARGNVHIVQPGRSLSSDWLAFSNTTRRGVATGHVVLEDSGQRIEADVIQFGLDDLRGILFGGRFESKETGFLATGEEVRKVGPQQYEFDEGTFTTCRCPDGGREPWLIRADEAELEVGGYGTVRNTVVDVLGVPVFWLPWMRYPLLTDRATGLLFPVINSSSRTGLDIGLPVFWAPLPSLNVTFTPHWLAKRGFKPDLELEYVFGEKSTGDFFASGILGDNEVNPNSNDTPFSDNRYALAWLQDTRLSEGWRWVADGKMFSDNAYPFDFRDFHALRSDRWVESLTFAEKRFGSLGRYGFLAGGRYTDDMQNPNNRDRDPFLLQRAGEIAVSGVPQPIVRDRPLDFAFDAQLVNFYPRETADSFYGLPAIGHDTFVDTGVDGVPSAREPGFDAVTNPDPDGDDYDPITNPGGTELNGRYNEGEGLVDRGQRLLLNPRVSLPLRLGDVAELNSELGYLGTYYQTSEHAFSARHLGTALVELRTRLRRTLDLPFADGRATHLLEPRLTWTAVTSASQNENPLFVPRSVVLQERLRQLDLYNVLRDPSDRIGSSDAVTLALGNRMFVAAPPSPDGMLQPPRLLADVTLSASWDFSNDQSRDVYLDGVLFPRHHFKSRFSAGWDINAAEVSEALFEFAYSDEIGNDVGIAYRKVQDVPPFFDAFESEGFRFDKAVTSFDKINQIELFGRYAFTKLWAVSYRLRYSIDSSLTLANQVGLEYISRCRCWAVRLEFEDERQAGYSAGIRYRVMGLGDDTVRPFGSWRRGSNDPLLEAL